MSDRATELSAAVGALLGAENKTSAEALAPLTDLPAVRSAAAVDSPEELVAAARRVVRAALAEEADRLAEVPASDLGQSESSLEAATRLLDKPAGWTRTELLESLAEEVYGGKSVRQVRRRLNNDVHPFIASALLRHVSSDADPRSVEPAGPADAGTDETLEHEAGGNDERGVRRTRAIAAGGVAILIAVAVVVAVARRSTESIDSSRATPNASSRDEATTPTTPADDNSGVNDQAGDEAAATITSDTSPSGHCPVAMGSVPVDVDVSVRRLARLIAEEAADPDLLAGRVCAVTAVYPSGLGVRQDIVGADGRESIAFASESGAHVLHPSAWQSYQRWGDDALGEPTGYGRRDGLVVLTVEIGELVGQAVDGPMYWVHPTVADFLASDPALRSALGAPMSNPAQVGADLQQDFVGGYLRTDASAMENALQGIPITDPIDIDAVLVSRPSPPNWAGRIARHRDGTAWWVTPDLHRQWIVDGGTYNCLGGDSNLVRDEFDEPLQAVPGYVIALLPLGDSNATCG